MKRKRRALRVEEASKRPKLDCKGADQPDWGLLKQYYTTVSTLRHYLAARLTKVSKRRRRELLQYGRRQDGDAAGTDHLSVLLDTIVVGAFKDDHPIDAVDIDKDITVFTQQVADASADITPTQGALKQSEVGYCARTRSHYSLAP